MTDEIIFDKERQLALRAFKAELDKLSSGDRRFYELAQDEIVDIMTSSNPEDALHRESPRLRKTMTQEEMGLFQTFVRHCNYTYRREKEKAKERGGEGTVVEVDFSKGRRR